MWFFRSGYAENGFWRNEVSQSDWDEADQLHSPFIEQEADGELRLFNLTIKKRMP